MIDKDNTGSIQDKYVDSLIQDIERIRADESRYIRNIHPDECQSIVTIDGGEDDAS